MAPALRLTVAAMTNVLFLWRRDPRRLLERRGDLPVVCSVCGVGAGRFELERAVWQLSAVRGELVAYCPDHVPWGQSSRLWHHCFSCRRLKRTSEFDALSGEYEIVSVGMAERNPTCNSCDVGSNYGTW